MNTNRVNAGSMHWSRIQSVLLAIPLIAACSAAPALTPVQASVRAPRQALSPEPPTTPNLPASAPDRPLPTASIQTPVPALDLPHDSPLLAYFTWSGSGKKLHLVDPYSLASAEFRFPPGTILPNPATSGVSPDARFFTMFRGGTLYRSSQYLSSVSTDFQLQIMDLQTQRVVFTQNLVSPEYPSNMEPIATYLSSYYPFDLMSDDEIIKETQYALLAGLLSVAWSPDASLLAFASQAPGPSSDMYFYSPSADTSWRASSEIGHVQSLAWAPDSANIALITALWQSQGADEITYVHSRDGHLQLTDSDGYFLQWGSSQFILKSHGVDYGDGYSDLRAISTSSDLQLTLWEETFSDFAALPDLSSLVLARTEIPPYEKTPPGLFWKSTGWNPPESLSPALYWDVEYWGSRPFVFAAAAPGQGTFGLDIHGDLTRLDALPWKMEPSPDSSRIALFAYGVSGPFDLDDGPYGLIVLDSTSLIKEEVTDYAVHCVRWSPDSHGLAYESGGELYVWDPSTSTSRDIGAIEPWGCDFRWIAR
jgi:hypothetical protein